jgi:hypothetical protein
VKQLFLVAIAILFFTGTYYITSVATIHSISARTAFTKGSNISDGDTISLSASIFDTADGSFDYTLRLRNAADDPLENVLIQLNGETLSVFNERTAGDCAALMFQRVSMTDDSMSGFHNIRVEGPGVIMVEGSNVTGTVNSRRSAGVKLAGAQDSIGFVNLEIVQGADTGGTCVFLAAVGDLTGDPHSISRTNPELESKGYYHIYFDSVNFGQDARNYYSREEHWGSIYAGHDRTWVPPDSLEAIFGLTVDYNHKFYGCTIDSTFSQGLHLTGLVIVDSCVFNGGARNDIFEKSIRGKVKTVSSVLDTVGPVFDSGACFGCTGQEFEVGQRNWNGSGYDGITGQRTSTFSSAWDAGDSVATDSIWVDDFRTGDSRANPYLLVLSDGQPGASASGAYAGSQITRNTFQTMANSAGARGILIQNPMGTEAEPVIIRGNTFDLNEGPNAFDGEGHTNCIRIRYGAHPSASWDGGWVLIDSNTIAATVDGASTDIEGVRDTIKDTSLLSGAEVFDYRYGNNAHNFFITLTEVAGFESVKNITLRHNHCTIDLKAGDVTGDAQGYSLFYDNDDNGTTDTGYSYSVDSIVENYFSAPLNSVSIGVHDGNSSFVKLVRDTLHQEGSDGDYETIRTGTNRSASTLSSDNAIVDGVYLNGASLSDILFRAGSDHEWFTIRTLRILVVGDNGMGITGSTVELWPDAYDTDTVLTGVTAGQGTVQGELTYRYDASTGSDSAGFTTLNGHQGWGIVSPDTSAIADTILTFTDAPNPMGMIIPLAGVNGTEDTTGWLTSSPAASGGLRVKVRN